MNKLLEINTSDCENVGALVEKMKRLGMFPNYCGPGWDAFEECLLDFSEETDLECLIFTGFSIFLLRDESNGILSDIVNDYMERQKIASNLKIEIYD